MKHWYSKVKGKTIVAAMRRYGVFVAAVSVLVANASVAGAQPNPSSSAMSAADAAAVNSLRQQLETSVSQDEARNITTSVEIQNLQNGRLLYDHNQNAVQFAASINKLPIAWLTLQDLRAGKITMNQTLTWTTDDQRAGAGVYDQPGAPTQGSLRDVLFDMLNPSGNTAVRIIVTDVLGGAQAVNDRLAQVPEIPNTRLQPLDPTHFYVGNSTSHEALWVLQQILASSDSYSNFIKNALATNIYTYYGVRSQLAGNNYIVLVNKVGILDDPTGDNRHDVGIIYNTKTHKSYGYSFMTTSPDPSQPPASYQAEYSLEQMGRATLQFAGDKPLKQHNVQPQQQALPQPEQKTMY